MGGGGGGPRDFDAAAVDGDDACANFSSTTSALTASTASWNNCASVFFGGAGAGGGAAFWRSVSFGKGSFFVGALRAAVDDGCADEDGFADDGFADDGFADDGFAGDDDAFAGVAACVFFHCFSWSSREPKTTSGVALSEVNDVGIARRDVDDVHATGGGHGCAVFVL